MFSHSKSLAYRDNEQESCVGIFQIAKDLLGNGDHFVNYLLAVHH